MRSYSKYSFGELTSTGPHRFDGGGTEDVASAAQGTQSGGMGSGIWGSAFNMGDQTLHSAVGNVYGNGTAESQLYGDSSQDPIMNALTIGKSRREAIAGVKENAGYNQSNFNSLSDFNSVFSQDKSLSYAEKPGAGKTMADIGEGTSRGAAIGAQFGGGYGAIIGGAIGLVASSLRKIGQKSAREKYNAEVGRFNTNLESQREQALENLNTNLKLQRQANEQYII